VRSEGAYLFEAEGIVGPDGGIEFKQLKKSLFSAPWAYRVEAGRLIMPEKLNAITASTPVFVAISAAKEKELEVEYDQQRLAEAHRKREQSQKWTQMLEGASTALGATNQALSEVQRETQVQAAADRQRAMEAESERAASLARQTAIANDAAAQRATQQREDQQRAANAQAAREKTAAASARPTTIASSQSSAPTLPVPNAADAASVEPKYAITPSTYTPSELKSNCWVVDAPSKVATGFSRNSEQDARDEAMTNTKRCKTVSEMVCDMGRDFDSVKDGKYVNVKPFWTCHIGYHCGETQKKCEIKPTAGSKQ
jgi:hypothetical protein